MKSFAFVSVLFIYCFSSALVACFTRSTRPHSLRDYSLGYSSITIPVLVSGLLATILGAGHTFDHVHDIFLFGFPFITIQIFRMLSWWISSKIFPRNVSSFNECLSISHIMYVVYGKIARWITTILTISLEIGIIAAQMIAVAYVLINVLMINSDAALIIALLMITSFSLMGGVRTIVQTGVFQFALFFLLLPISYTIISYKYGGVSNLSANLPITKWGVGSIQGSKLIYWSVFLILPECSSSFIQKC